MNDQETLPYPLAPAAPGLQRVLGLPVNGGGARAIKDFMSGVVARGEQAIVLYLNVYGANLAHVHPWLSEFYQEAQLVICDGDGIRWGLAMLGETPPPKVTYNIWLWDLCLWCQKHHQSLYLLGGKPGVADRARERMALRLPGLRIAGCHDGYFSKSGPENQQVLDEIRRIRPDIVLVCFGMPVQERWLLEHARHLPVHVFLTGGAALDYAAGEVAVVPRWMGRLHMEWLFRLGLEPKRLFRRYIFGNPQFLYRVLRERIKRRPYS